MKNNYHTHTFRCHHANGTDEEYVKAAIAGGYQILGFSDHAPWQYRNPQFVPRIRMPLSEFVDYYESINRLKIKYADQITIKIGLETEYFPQYMDWMQKFAQDQQLDYLIFGNHFVGSDENGVYYGYECDDDEILVQYQDDVLAGLKTGLYSCLAHPDLFMRGRMRFDKLCEQVSYQICEAAKATNTPLEYNLAGMQVSDMMHIVQYPYPAFWEIAAKVGNQVIIGCDAHDPSALSNPYYYDKALKELATLGLQRIDSLDITKFKKKVD